MVKGTKEQVSAQRANGWQAVDGGRAGSPGGGDLRSVCWRIPATFAGLERCSNVRGNNSRRTGARHVSLVTDRRGLPSPHPRGCVRQACSPSTPGSARQARGPGQQPGKSRAAGCDQWRSRKCQLGQSRSERLPAPDAPGLAQDTPALSWSAHLGDRPLHLLWAVCIPGEHHLLTALGLQAT